MPAGLWQPFHERNMLLEFNRLAAQSTGLVGELLLLIPPLRELLFSSALERPYRLAYSTARSAAAAQRHARGYDEAHDGMLGIRFDRADSIDASVPVTIAFGDHDQLLPADTSQDRSLAPAHSSWVVMNRVGHAPMWDDPRARWPSSAPPSPACPTADPHPAGLRDMTGASTVTMRIWRVPATAVPGAIARVGAQRRRLRHVPGLTFAKQLGTGSGQSFTLRDAELRRWALLTVFADEAAAGRFDDSEIVHAWRQAAEEGCGWSWRRCPAGAAGRARTPLRRRRRSTVGRGRRRP